MSEDTKTFKGFVAKISTKTGEGKRGPWTAYSAKMEKEDGTEYPEWLGFGFEKPDFAEGDYVRLEATKDDNGRWKVDPDSVSKPKNAPARAKKGGSSGGYAGKPGGFKPGFKNSPEDISRMTYANARDVAVSLVTVLLANDALPITKAQTKAGEASRYDEIVAAVKKLAEEFTRDSGVEVPKSLNVSGKAAAGKLPDTDDDADEDDTDESDDD